MKHVIYFLIRLKTINLMVKKNAIAFKVIKSSGQSFETVVGKKSESYKQFKELFKNVSNSLNGKDRKIKNYLKAIHFKIKRDKVILNKIGKNEELLENYFKNNFDEKFHENGDIKIYKLFDKIHIPNLWRNKN